MSAPLVERVREQAQQCAAAGSPLMHALLTGAADDLEAGGPTAALLGPLEADPPGTVPALRLAAALHRLVLERRAPLLATHYPSVGGTAPVGLVWPAARRTVEQELPALQELVRRPVQTNEVGRSAVLLGGLAVLAARWGLPQRLLEVGASAGLNLHADAFALRVQGRLRGPADSPVVLDEPWAGALPPDVPVHVVSRSGCDPDPLDPTTAEGRLVLTSCVWADQRERLERLRGALVVAARAPVPVRRAPASSFLRDALAVSQDGVGTVVWHSVVRQYMTPDERAAVDGLLADAGQRATASAPLARLALEPERSGGASAFAVTLQTWPGGRTEVLAQAEGHGPPVQWRPPPA